MGYDEDNFVNLYPGYDGMHYNGKNSVGTIYEFPDD